MSGALHVRINGYKMANTKKENSNSWSEKAIDIFINFFQWHECIWNVTSGYYKDQNRNCLPKEEFDMSVQEYDINRYDYKKMEYSPRPVLTFFLKTLHHSLLT